MHVLEWLRMKTKTHPPGNYPRLLGMQRLLSGVPEYILCDVDSDGYFPVIRNTRPFDEPSLVCWVGTPVESIYALYDGSSLSNCRVMEVKNLDFADVCRKCAAQGVKWVHTYLDAGEGKMLWCPVPIATFFQRQGVTQ